MKKNALLCCMLAFLFVLSAFAKPTVFTPLNCKRCSINQDTGCRYCELVICIGDSGRDGCMSMGCNDCQDTGSFCSGTTPCAPEAPAAVMSSPKPLTEQPKNGSLGTLKISQKMLLDIAKVNPRFATVSVWFDRGFDLTNYSLINSSNFPITLEDANCLITQYEQPNSCYQDILERGKKANLAEKAGKIKPVQYIRTVELTSLTSGICHLTVINPGYNDPEYSTMTWYIQKNTDQIWQITRWNIN